MPQFKQVDVFTDEKFKGNPVAVFFEGEKLSSEEMAHISKWTNLSEATFIFKPNDSKAQYKVRIFSLDVELPFAGHPTIGTCSALIESGLIKPVNGKVIQECGAGLVELTVNDNGEIMFKQPTLENLEVPKSILSQVPASLGVSRFKYAALYNVGPKWLVVHVEDEYDLSKLNHSLTHISKLSQDLQITGFQIVRSLNDSVYETRTFAPAIGIDEDPVCGSGSAATGALLRDFGGVSDTVSIRQGSALGREGKVTVRIGREIFVSGRAVTTIIGEY